MRRCLTLFGLLAVAGPAPAAETLAFQYTIERGQEGNIVESAFLRGFETREGLRLKVKLNQESYCYVMVGAPAGGFRLVFPDSGTLKAGGLPINEWARIPKSTFLRLGEDPKVARMYIIVAAQPVPELDEAADRGNAVLSEATALQIRDRHSGGSSRELDGNTVSIKYVRKAAEAAAVVEEIALQPIDTLKR